MKACFLGSAGLSREMICGMIWRTATMPEVDCLDAKTVHTTEGGDAHRQLLIAAFRTTL